MWAFSMHRTYIIQNRRFQSSATILKRCQKMRLTWKCLLLRSKKSFKILLFSGMFNIYWTAFLHRLGSKILAQWNIYNCYDFISTDNHTINRIDLKQKVSIGFVHLWAASNRPLWATCAKTAAPTWFAAELRYARWSALNEASYRPNARRVIVSWCSKMQWADEQSITLFVLCYALLSMFLEQ